MKLRMPLMFCLVLFGNCFAADQTPAPLKELFPNGLEDVNGKAVSLDQLKGKLIGVYFSAHWCPPCRAFTPKLVEFRDKNVKEFEVVFVSSDHTAADQAKYIKEAKMQWYVLKWKSKEGDALKKKFNVSGIPKLVILKPNGELLTENGRNDVTSNPDKCLKQWKEKAK
ncbi:MAG: thioredoxin family protein [Planctomycetota bacterium]